MRYRGKLVYWGAGNIGKACLSYHPNIKPEFFIDSNWGTGSIQNIPVKKPDEIADWDKIFIVITSTAIEEIATLLNSKMLKKNQNYMNYKEFFGTSGGSIEESISRVSEFMQTNGAFENAVLIVAPVFISRESRNMIRFFKQYSIKRLPQKCILFSPLGVVDETEAQRIIGYPVLNWPEIYRWQGNHNCIDCSSMSHADLLSEDEKEWIAKLVERKVYQNKELSYQSAAEIYWYFKNIFKILNPLRVLIWGGWKWENYILSDIAKRREIPYGFMEHGWVSGTIQFDRGGISGQSEYAIRPSELYRRDIERKHVEIKELKDYIISHKADTGKFRNIKEDDINLGRIHKGKKTVFFVGMDDYGIGINPQSDYWGKYVSSLFSSTQEALLFIAKICKKNDWNIVFKPHPNAKGHNQIADDLLMNNNIIQVIYTDIDRLIQLADVVISIASAVDYKVLIYGKPLVQLGVTTLYKKGCSYEINSLTVIEDQIKTAMEKGMTEQQNQSFDLHMTRLLDKYLWDDLSDRELRFGLPLDIDFFDEQ